MITINILRERLERSRSRMLFRRLLVSYAIGLCAILFILATISTTKRVMIDGEVRKMRQFEEDILKNAAMVNKMKTYQALGADMTQRLATVREELLKRILWAKKLEVIAAALPPDICLTAIDERPAPASDPTAMSSLAMKGYLPAEPSRDRATIIAFMENLRSRGGEHFASVVLTRVVQQDVEKTPIRTFTIDCEVQPSDEKPLALP